MNNNLEVLKDGDVISVLRQEEGRFASGDTLKVQQLLNEYAEYIEPETKTTNHSEIFTQGMECEILRQDGEHKG